MDFKSYLIKNIYPKLKKDLKIRNDLALPTLQKIVIHTGIGPFLKNEQSKTLIFEALSMISGQKPIETRAKKSISGFKIRENEVIGYKTTLRRKRAYDFLYKLINVILPRIKDFRGIDKKSLDKQGNLTIGIRDAFVFPEVDREKVFFPFGLEIVLNFKKSKKDHIIKFLELIGFPFKR